PGRSAVGPAAVGGPGRSSEADTVLDAHRLVWVVELDDGRRLEEPEDVGQVEVARLVVVLYLAELFDQAAAVEAVDADVDLVDLLALLLRRVLTLDDPVQRSVWLADDPTVVACRVFDAGEGRIGSGRLVRVDDLED